MPWATPNFSRRRVDQAGADLINPACPPSDHSVALAIVNNWRSAHGHPLNTFQTNLRITARKVDADAIVAQRTKRLSSIRTKLQRFPHMKLSKVQDIGGCRAVLPDIEQVDDLYDRYMRSRAKHTLLRCDDYLNHPKSSGYRGIHLVYGYMGKDIYNGLRVELQLRSRLQHAWATAVETVSMFTGNALKASTGEADWLRFFELMGTELSFQELTAPVPNTPTSRADLRKELRIYCSRLQVLEKLTSYGAAMNLPFDEMAESAHPFYYLLLLDTAGSRLTVYDYGRDQLAEAQARYEALELETGDDQGADVVLVHADSLLGLRRAYPNYFADTQQFVQIVREATE